VREEGDAVAECGESVGGIQAGSDPEARRMTRGDC